MQRNINESKCRKHLLHISNFHVKSHYVALQIRTSTSWSKPLKSKHSKLKCEPRVKLRWSELLISWRNIFRNEREGCDRTNTSSVHHRFMLSVLFYRRCLMFIDCISSLTSPSNQYCFQIRCVSCGYRVWLSCALIRVFNECDVCIVCMFGGMCVSPTVMYESLAAVPLTR